MIVLRGHHLRLLYGYMLAKGNPYSLQIKKEAIIQASVDAGHSRRHGQNTIDMLEKALVPEESISLIESIDDICQSCNSRLQKRCTDFIPYDISAASDDRGTLYFYGLKPGVYPSGFIQERLVKIGAN